jgi:hypothetical protein
LQNIELAGVSQRVSESGSLQRLAYRARMMIKNQIFKFRETARRQNIELAAVSQRVIRAFAQSASC